MFLCERNPDPDLYVHTSGRPAETNIKSTPRRGIVELRIYSTDT